ncbi:polysaccharide pyruvyl transferase family protein [Vibrio chagasii]|uniref:polysaccharide pyruvyl transferase family protein n=1 Tax=Vibrio chagasii TaxID=170679 RepID=UPI003DA07CA5
MYKVVIEGAYGEKNFGDDALLKVIYDKVVSEFDSEDILIRSKTKVMDYPLVELIGESIVKTVDDTRDLKAENIIYGGGTQFFFFKKSSSLRHKISMAISNPYLIWIFFQRRLFKYRIDAKSHYVGVGIGPFEDESKLEQLKGHFENYDSFFVRDKVSERYALKLGIDRVQRYTDICFSEDYNNILKKRNKVSKIAVILRDWPHSNSNFTASVLNEKLSNEDGIEYIILGNDLTLEKELKSLGLKFKSYDPNKEDFLDFIKYLNNFDLIVTSRYHGAIYSVLLEIPCIALSIEPKLSIAANELGLYSCLDYSNLNELPDLIDNLKINIKSEVFKISKVRLEKKIEADDMLSILMDKLK